MASTALVEQLVSAAADVTRYLPEAHVWSRWFYRDARFRAAAAHFVRLLYKLDVPRLTDSELAEAERLTRVAINVIETHMLLRYTPRDTEACRFCSDLIATLRDSLDALDAGLPTDPAQRPSEDELMESLSVALERSESLAANPAR